MNLYQLLNRQVELNCPVVIGEKHKDAHPHRNKQIRNEATKWQQK